MFIKYSPLAVTLLLVIWTAIVSPYSRYGDDWAIYPALLALPSALLLHVYLVLSSEDKINHILYGFGHLLFLFVVWIYCLMKISKDSL